jgi:hypothetical protein
MTAVLHILTKRCSPEGSNKAKYSLFRTPINYVPNNQTAR